ncbi:MAG: CoA transferase [Chloroflexi bacterium]|nr:CoA transferase [Chloroflexota bacterium]
MSQKKLMGTQVARALDNIRVIDVGGFHAGPGAAYILGDLGAQVVKVEEPLRGDPYRGLTVLQGDASVVLPGGRVIPVETANRNKRGITLNLKKEAARAVLYRLIEKSDVFVTNYSSTTLKKLGLDYDALSQRNPRLIYGASSGYGPEGPDKDRRSFDSLTLARSGLMWAAGEREFDEPVGLVGATMDQLGATMLAFAICVALFHRQRTGAGQRVDVSQLGSAMHFQGINVDMALLRGRGFPRHSRTRTKSVFLNTYLCADKKWLALGEGQQDKYWPQLCDALDMKELEKDPRFATSRARRENYVELNALVNKIFASRGREEWLQVFKDKACGFAYDRVNTIEEAVKDTQVLENQYVVDFDHPALGPVKLIGFPMRFSKTPCAIQREAPEVGQHTEEVLLEYGYTWDDIASLRGAGAL